MSDLVNEVLLNLIILCKNWFAGGDNFFDDISRTADSFALGDALLNSNSILFVTRVG